jgi:hypothetical protein
MNNSPAMPQATSIVPGRIVLAPELVHDNQRDMKTLVFFSIWRLSVIDFWCLVPHIRIKAQQKTQD